MIDDAPKPHQQDRELLDFFNLIFGDKPPSDNILVWTVDSRSESGKTSVWCQTVEQAAQVCAEMSGIREVSVYCGTGTTTKNKGSHKRAENVEIETIYGLWADIDFRKAGNQKAYPPGMPEVEEVFSKLEHQPSLIVHTGGGVHGWWLFKEPWHFEDEKDRQRGQALVRRWQRYLMTQLQKFGWVMDNTHDLARVLRPAGTTNWKYAEPVRIYDANENRYNPTEIEDFVGTMPLDKGDEAIIETAEGMGLVLDPKVQIPHEVIALCETDAQFDLTWKRKRKDLVSQSEYDLAIASRAAIAGVSDQRIADMILTHRRKSGEDMKLRPDYYARTISKGKATSLSEQAKERISNAVQDVETGVSKPEDVRAAVLTDLSSIFGFKVNRVVKYVSETPSYVLKSELGEIYFPNVSFITQQRKFTDQVAATTERNLVITKKEFPRIAQAVLNAVEYEELGADSSIVTRVGMWLSRYFENEPPQLDRAEAVTQRRPFYPTPDKLSIAFFPDGFRNWLLISFGERFEGRTLSTMLRGAGCSPVTSSYRKRDGKVSSVYVWHVPVKLVEANDDAA